MLHDHYTLVQVKGLTDEEEEILAQQDEDFLTEMQTSVCSVLEDLKLYREAIAREKRVIKSRQVQAKKDIVQAES